jgi:hypothetical protein
MPHPNLQALTPHSAPPKLDPTSDPAFASEADAKTYSREIIPMKKTTAATLAALIYSLALSPSLSAKTVFSTRAHCFRMGELVPSGWNGNLKIKLQRKLTDRRGEIVEAVANIHGFKSVNPPINYYNQLIGAAGYISPGDQEIIDDSVQITLLGTSIGTDTTEAGEVPVTWFRNNILMLGQWSGGKAFGHQDIYSS